MSWEKIPSRKLQTLLKQNCCWQNWSWIVTGINEQEAHTRVFIFSVNYKYIFNYYYLNDWTGQLILLSETYCHKWKICYTRHACRSSYIFSNAKSNIILPRIVPSVGSRTTGYTRARPSVPSSPSALAHLHRWENASRATPGCWPSHPSRERRAPPPTPTTTCAPISYPSRALSLPPLLLPPSHKSAGCGVRCP